MNIKQLFWDKLFSCKNTQFFRRNRFIDISVVLYTLGLINYAFRGFMWIFIIENSQSHQDVEAAEKPMITKINLFFEWALEMKVFGR